MRKPIVSKHLQIVDLGPPEAGNPSLPGLWRHRAVNPDVTGHQEQIHAWTEFRASAVRISAGGLFLIWKTPRLANTRPLTIRQ